MDKPHRINKLRRVLHRLLMNPALSPLWAGVLHHADKLTLRLNGGRFTVTSLLAGLPTLLLTTTGAKTGQPRSLPIACVPDGDKYALIASNFGRPHFPSWYHNLKAHPECVVRVGGRMTNFTAREVYNLEYDRYWEMAVNIYAGYAAYKARAKRRIPVMLLEPEKIDGL